MFAFRGETSCAVYLLLEATVRNTVGCCHLMIRATAASYTAQARALDA